jgi:hypothetical protein
MSSECEDDGYITEIINMTEYIKETLQWMKSHYLKN